MKKSEIAPITVNDVTVELGKHTDVISYIREVCSYATNYRKDGIKFSWVVDGAQKTFSVEANKFNENLHSTIKGKIKFAGTSEAQDIEDVSKADISKVIPSGFGSQYLASITDGFDYSNLRFSKCSKLMKELKGQKSATDIILLMTRRTNAAKDLINFAKKSYRLETLSCPYIAISNQAKERSKAVAAQIKALTTAATVSLATLANEVTRAAREQAQD